MKKNILISMLVLFFILPLSTGFTGESHDENHICFMRLDADQDEKVTPGEFEKFFPDDPGLFEKIDQDQNGFLSHEEYEDYWAGLD